MIELIVKEGQPALAWGNAQGLHGVCLKRKPEDDDREGVFVRWNWDGQALTVENDRFGFHPVFYYADAQRVVMARSLAEMVSRGVPVEADDDALSVFLRMGFFVGEDTAYRHVRTLPPGGTLRWTPGQWNVTGDIMLAKEQPTTREAALDDYIGQVRQAVQAWTPTTENALFPLSGGRDSRHIAFELARQGYRPRLAVTSTEKAPRPFEDARIARALCERLKWRHEEIAPRQTWFESACQHYHATSFCADEGIWIGGIAERHDGAFDCVFDGAGGDLFPIAYFHYAPNRTKVFEEGNLDAMAANLLDRAPADYGFTESAFEHILQPGVYKRWSRERAVARLKRELARHMDMPDRVDSFFFWNRTRREIGFGPLAHFTKTPVRLPYLHTDLWKFSASLPLSITLDGKLHTEALIKAFPEYADIPFEDKSAPWMDTQPRLAGMARGLAQHWLLARPSHWLNEKFLRPRLLRSLISRPFAVQSGWFIPAALYVSQLERLTRSAAH